MGRFVGGETVEINIKIINRLSRRMIQLNSELHVERLQAYYLLIYFD